MGVLLPTHARRRACAYEVNVTARSRTCMVPRSHSNQNRICCDPNRYSESRIGPQIVPLLSHPVTAFAHHPCSPSAERLSWLLSCGLRQTGKEAIDSDSVLHTLSEQVISVCPCASPLIITRGFLGSTSWKQPDLGYRSYVLISTVLLLHLLIVYAWKSA